MLRRFAVSAVLAASIFVAGCHHAKVQNPIANIDSKQPDKVLYDRAMDSMKHGKYTIARTLLETLINTYPDSEYIARAKLSVGDSWYAEGGTAALQQAEAEYKDFITFFPNLPEAAEAQFKVANIHYRQMEKPDRDFNQAERAEDEYKNLIQQFPDSKLVPDAKQKLRDVQEVLAERQFRIARFYFIRDNIAACEARLTSLTESYPLYSNIDEALFTLGSIFERQANIIAAQKAIPPATKEKLTSQYQQKAIAAYSKIVSRYPLMERSDDAKKRLAALHAPVPQATPEAIAMNKAEEESREETGRIHNAMMNFHKHPDMSMSAKVGEPNLDPEVMASAPALVQQLNNEIQLGVVEANQKLGVQSVKAGTGAAPGANQPAPGSSQPAVAGADSTTGTPAAQPPDRTNELQITPQADQAATQGSTGTQQQAAQPAQAPSSNSDQQQAGNTNSNGNGQQNSDTQDSSSKKKSKKGIRKLIPF
jgi:outer membrane protein assembly factor BamD